MKGILPKMRKPISFLLLVLILIVPVLSVQAITWGQPDNGAHPNVGALLIDLGRISPEWRGLYFATCSGTLITPTVFLTAAHCDVSDIHGSNEAFVTFSEDASVGSRPRVLTGRFVRHENFPGPANDSFDIAVVILDRPVRGITPAQLPTAGQFDTARVGDLFTAVGYGLHEPVPTPGQGITYDAPDTRQFSHPTLNSVNNSWLRLSQNAATGDSGACFGDSGGPNFWGNTNIIAGTTITGDAVCVATNVIYRLDTPVAREFLSRFVTVP
jgi:secreted trypsin-like serine protease